MFFKITVSQLNVSIIKQYRMVFEVGEFPKCWRQITALYPLPEFRQRYLRLISRRLTINIERTSVIPATQFA